MVGVIGICAGVYTAMGCGVTGPGTALDGNIGRSADSVDGAAIGVGAVQRTSTASDNTGAYAVLKDNVQLHSVRTVTTNSENRTFLTGNSLTVQINGQRDIRIAGLRCPGNCHRLSYICQQSDSLCRTFLVNHQSLCRIHSSLQGLELLAGAFQLSNVDHDLLPLGNVGHVIGDRISHSRFPALEGIAGACGSAFECGSGCAFFHGVDLVGEDFLILNTVGIGDGEESLGAQKSIPDFHIHGFLMGIHQGAVDVQFILGGCNTVGGQPISGFPAAAFAGGADGDGQEVLCCAQDVLGLLNVSQRNGGQQSLTAVDLDGNGLVSQNILQLQSDAFVVFTVADTVDCAPGSFLPLSSIGNLSGNGLSHSGLPAQELVTLAGGSAFECGSCFAFCHGVNLVSEDFLTLHTVGVGNGVLGNSCGLGAQDILTGIGAHNDTALRMLIAVTCGRFRQVIIQRNDPGCNRSGSSTAFGLGDQGTMGTGKAAFLRENLQGSGKVILNLNMVSAGALDEHFIIDHGITANGQQSFPVEHIGQINAVAIEAAGGVVAAVTDKIAGYLTAQDVDMAGGGKRSQAISTGVNHTVLLTGIVDDLTAVHGEGSAFDGLVAAVEEVPQHDSSTAGCTGGFGAFGDGAAVHNEGSGHLLGVLQVLHANSAACSSGAAGNGAAVHGEAGIDRGGGAQADTDSAADRAAVGSTGLGSVGGATIGDGAAVHGEGAVLDVDTAGNLALFGAVILQGYTIIHGQDTLGRHFDQSAVHSGGTHHSNGAFQSHVTAGLDQQPFIVAGLGYGDRGFSSNGNLLGDGDRSAEFSVLQQINGVAGSGSSHGICQGLVLFAGAFDLCHIDDLLIAAAAADAIHIVMTQSLALGLAALGTGLGLGAACIGPGMLMDLLTCGGVGGPCTFALIPGALCYGVAVGTISGDLQVRSLVPFVVPVVGKIAGSHTAENNVGIARGNRDFIIAIGIRIGHVQPVVVFAGCIPVVNSEPCAVHQPVGIGLQVQGRSVLRRMCMGHRSHGHYHDQCQQHCQKTQGQGCFAHNVSSFCFFGAKRGGRKTILPGLQAATEATKRTAFHHLLAYII